MDARSPKTRGRPARRRKDQAQSYWPHRVSPMPGEMTLPRHILEHKMGKVVTELGPACC